MGDIRSAETIEIEQGFAILNVTIEQNTVWFILFYGFYVDIIEMRVS